MTPYSVIVAITVAANLGILVILVLRMNRRVPRLALAFFLTTFSASHAISIGLREGAIPPSAQGVGFGTLVLGYVSLALFVLLFLHGEGLTRRIPTVLGIALPGAALAVLGGVGGWGPSEAFRPATDPLGVTVNGYLIGCLAIALAESLAVLRKSPGRGRESFPLLAGSALLIVAGPVYGFELALVGLGEFTGTNLAVPLAGALFGSAMARSNPLRFPRRIDPGEPRLPWTVPAGVYLVGEVRPKYARGLFLAASQESPGLAILSGPVAGANDLAGRQVGQLPAGEDCAAVLAATASEFLSRNPSGVLLIDDVSYPIVNSGLPSTTAAVRRVTSGRPNAARIILSLSHLVKEERAAFNSVEGVRVEAPDVEGQIAILLERHIGAAKDALARAARGIGKRVEDLNLLDIPAVTNQVLKSFAKFRTPTDSAAQASLQQVSQNLAADLEGLVRTSPLDRNTPGPPTEDEIPVVHAADVLGEAPEEAEPGGIAISRSLGASVREAFLGTLGPGGEPVYRRVLGGLRKDVTTLRPEDLPRVAQLAQEAIEDLGGAIDVADARRDLVERAQRLRAQLNGLARGER